MSEILRYTLSHPSYLPSTYTPISYLESSGSLWIDTGYKPNNTTVVVGKVLLTSTSNGHFFGSRNASTAGAGYAVGVVGGYFVSDFNGNRQNFTLETNKIIDFYKNKNVTVVNGVSKTNTDSTFQVSYNAVLFALQDTGSVSVDSNGVRIYGLKIWDGDSLVRDFRPCYYQPTSSSTPVYGMFDVVQLKFYSSASSTAFTGGPELCQSLPSDYQQVEYLLFNPGKSYSTGISKTSGLSITREIGIRYKSGESGRDLFGYSSAGGGYDGVTASGAWELHGTTTSKTSTDITLYNLIISTESYSELGTYVLGALGSGYSVRTKYISYLKLTIAGSLVADYIACYRRSDGQLGFYDFATSSFKAVGSTIGEFPLGPSLPWLSGVGNDTGGAANKLPVVLSGTSTTTTSYSSTISKTYTLSELGLVPGQTITGLANIVSNDGYSKCIRLQCYNLGNTTRVHDVFGNSVTNGISTATVTLADNVYNIHIEISTLPTSLTTCKHTYSNVKLELGSVATPYVPNSNGIPYNLHSSVLHPQGVYHNLPSGYLEVEWILTNGASGYIDTNLKLSTFKIEYCGLPISRSGNEVSLISCWSSSNLFFNLFSNNSSTVYFYHGSSVSVSSDWSKHTYIINRPDSSNFTVTTDGVSKASTTSSSTSSAVSIKIGARGDVNTSYSNGTTKCYYCKIWNGSTLVLDLIPCIRTSDSVVGMYDLVGMTFYAPSGTLLPGPAVGRLEGGIYFNGTDSKLLFTAPFTSLTSCTIAFWINELSTHTDSWWLAARTATGSGISVGLESNSIRFDYGSSWSTGVNITRNTWHHIAVTRTSSARILYVDGAAVANTGGGSTDNISNDALIGVINTSLTPNWTYACIGVMYDFRLYNEALSADAIKAIYLAK